MDHNRLLGTSPHPKRRVVFGVAGRPRGRVTRGRPPHRRLAARVRVSHFRLGAAPLAYRRCTSRARSTSTCRRIEQGELCTAPLAHRAVVRTSRSSLHQELIPASGAHHRVWSTSWTCARLSAPSSRCASSARSVERAVTYRGGVARRRALARTHLDEVSPLHFTIGGQHCTIGGHHSNSSLSALRLIIAVHH